MSNRGVAVATAPAKAVPPTALTAEPNELDIAARAYELYEKRGGEPGHDLDDWLQAERELKLEKKG